MAASLILRRAAGSVRRGTIGYLQQRQTVGVIPVGCLQHKQIHGGKRVCDSDMDIARWVPVRWASTEVASSGSGDRGLARVLKAEVAHEKDAYTPPKGLAKGPPRPFTLTDKPGKPDVILRRSYGSEDIALTCMSQSSDYEEDDFNEEDEEIPEDLKDHTVIVTVSVTKGADQPVLDFSCNARRDHIAIDHVYYLESKDDKEPVYEGPEFTDLDEDLQKEFEKYLEVRGINGNLANYLLDLVQDKEQREYMRWLQNVESFVKK